MSFAIGIDLGGTNIKAVLVDESGKVIDRAFRATNDFSSSIQDWSRAVSELIQQFESTIPGTAKPPVGFAAPGLAAPDERSIAFLPGKLAGLQGFDWTAFLERSDLCPVLNDAHAALLGEAWVGAAANYRNVVLVTLGTGVGGAILVEGRLLKGTIGRAGHIGHMCLDIEGAPSIVGTPGSVEDAIGDRTVAPRTRGRFTSTQALVEAHVAGDPEATQVWLKSIRCLGCAIASYINILDPEAVIIGGGIARAGDVLFEPLHRELDQIEWRPGGYRVQVLPAALGEWAGAIGVARRAMNP